MRVGDLLEHTSDVGHEVDDISHPAIAGIKNCSTIIRVRRITDRVEIPPVVFFLIPHMSEQNNTDPIAEDIDMELVTYYTLAAARQKLRERREIT